LTFTFVLLSVKFLQIPFYINVYRTGRIIMDGHITIQEKIASLEEQLERTNDNKEKLHLMFQLIDYVNPTNRKRAHTVAREAVALAEQLRQPIDIARSLYHLGTVEYCMLKPHETSGYLHRALAIFEELGDDIMAGKILHMVAITYEQSGKPEEALEIFLGNIKRFEAHNHVHWILQSLVGAGMSYKQRGEFPLALHYLFRAVDLAGSIEHRERCNQWVSRCCYNLAIIYAMIEERDKALDMFLKSLQCRRENGERASEANILHGLGTLLLTMGRLDEAAVYLQEALAVIRELAPNKSLEVYCLVNLGSLVHQQNMTEQAIQYYRQALVLGRSYDTAIDARCSALQGLGDIYRKRQDYNRSVRWLEKALAVAQKAGIHQLEYDIARDLSEVYEKLGDVAQAFYYHKQYMERKESIFGVRQQGAITAEQVKFAVSKEQAEKEKYRSEKEHLTMEVEKKKQELTKTALQLTQKTEFLKQVKKQVRELLHSRNGKAVLVRHLLQQFQQNDFSEHELHSFERQFEHMNDEFINRLAQQFPYLTPTELKVCALLKLNMNTKEIARMLSLSGRTIDCHRNNIRKKIGIAGSMSFAAFFAAFG
jgi:tetratricopeptide (TPR) repeat protein/DNA-binding CsgD family transcriptional regulator